MWNSLSETLSSYLDPNHSQTGSTSTSGHDATRPLDTSRRRDERVTAVQDPPHTPEQPTRLLLSPKSLSASGNQTMAGVLAAHPQFSVFRNANNSGSNDASRDVDLLLLERSRRRDDQDELLVETLASPRREDHQQDPLVVEVPHDDNNNKSSGSGSSSFHFSSLDGQDLGSLNFGDPSSSSSSASLVVGVSPRQSPPPPQVVVELGMSQGVRLIPDSPPPPPPRAAAAAAISLSSSSTSSRTAAAAARTPSRSSSRSSSLSRSQSVTRVGQFSPLSLCPSPLIGAPVLPPPPPRPVIIDDNDDEEEEEEDRRQRLLLRGQQQQLRRTSSILKLPRTPGTGRSVRFTESIIDYGHDGDEEEEDDEADDEADEFECEESPSILAAGSRHHHHHEQRDHDLSRGVGGQSEQQQQVEDETNTTESGGGLTDSSAIMSRRRPGGGGGQDSIVTVAGSSSSFLDKLKQVIPSPDVSLVTPAAAAGRPEQEEEAEKVSTITTTTAGEEGESTELDEDDAAAGRNGTAIRRQGERIVDTRTVTLSSPPVSSNRSDGATRQEGEGEEDPSLSTITIQPTRNGSTTTTAAQVMLFDESNPCPFETTNISVSVLGCSSSSSTLTTSVHGGVGVGGGGFLVGGGGGGSSIVREIFALDVLTETVDEDEDDEDNMTDERGNRTEQRRSRAERISPMMAEAGRRRCRTSNELGPPPSPASEDVTIVVPPLRGLEPDEEAAATTTTVVREGEGEAGGGEGALAAPPPEQSSSFYRRFMQSRASTGMSRTAAEELERLENGDKASPREPTSRQHAHDDDEEEEEEGQERDQVERVLVQGGSFYEVAPTASEDTEDGNSMSTDPGELATRTYLSPIVELSEPESTTIDSPLLIAAAVESSSSSRSQPPCRQTDRTRTPAAAPAAVAKVARGGGATLPPPLSTSKIPRPRNPTTTTFFSSLQLAAADAVVPLNVARSLERQHVTVEELVSTQLDQIDLTKSQRSLLTSLVARLEREVEHRDAIVDNLNRQLEAARQDVREVERIAIAWRDRDKRRRRRSNDHDPTEEEEEELKRVAALEETVRLLADELDTRLDENRRRRIDLERQVAIATRREETASHQLEQSQREVEALRATWRAEVDDRDRTTRRLREELSDLRQRRPRQEEEEGDRDRVDDDDEARQLDMVKKELVLRDEALASLRDELLIARRETTTRNEDGTTSLELEQARLAIADLTSRLVETEREVDDLRDQNGQLVDELDAQTVKLEDATIDRERLARLVEEQRVDLDEQRTQCDTALQAMRDLERAVAGFESQATVYERRLEQVEHDLDERATQLSRMTSARDALQAEKAQAVAFADKLKRESADREMRVSKLKKRIAELDEDVFGLNIALDAKQQEASHWKRQMSQLKLERNPLVPVTTTTDDDNKNKAGSRILAGLENHTLSSSSRLDQGVPRPQSERRMPPPLQGTPLATLGGGRRTSRSNLARSRHRLESADARDDDDEEDEDVTDLPHRYEETPSRPATVPPRSSKTRTTSTSARTTTRPPQQQQQRRSSIAPSTRSSLSLSSSSSSQLIQFPKLPQGEDDRLVVVATTATTEDEDPDDRSSRRRHGVSSSSSSRRASKENEPIRELLSSTTATKGGTTTTTSRRSSSSSASFGREVVIMA
ncbi:hypothetical protein JCM3766R1_001201 [Sporobolomyces carnicolor]